MPTAAPEPPADPPAAEAESDLRPLTGGAVMSAASRTAVAFTGAAATILVARLLGPSGAGGYAIAQTMIVLLTVATTLGIEHGIAYHVSARRWQPARANRTAQRMAFLSGLAGAALAVLARLLAPGAFGGLSVATVAVAACALPFALSWLYFSYVALANDRYEGFAIPPAAQSAVAFLFVATFGAIYGLSGAVVGFALAHVLTAAGTAFAARRTFSAENPGGCEARGAGQLRSAVGFGIKGYAANALQFLNFRLDLFILSAAAGAFAVGQYSVAVAVTGVLWLMPQALSDVLFPRIAALSARSDAAGRDFVEAKSLRHAVAVVLAVGSALVLVLVFLVVPVYGAAFRPAISLGLILLPGVALLGVGNTMSATIVGRGRPGYVLATTLITTPLTVVIYVILIPTLHATGAAIASSASYACSFALLAAFYRRVVGRRLSMRFLPTRSELADYRDLAPAIMRWLADRRRPQAIFSWLAR